MADNTTNETPKAETKTYTLLHPISIAVGKGNGSTQKFLPRGAKAQLTDEDAKRLKELGYIA